MNRRIATIFFLIILVGRSFACSCIDNGLAGNFARSVNVFEAVAIGSRIVKTDDPQSPQMREIVLFVGHQYKGHVQRKVHIRTKISGVSCGSLLPFGGRYLVFAYSSEAEGSMLYTSLCSGNKLFPFWRFGLRQNVRRLARGEKIPVTSKWAKVPSW